ncbi:MAG: DUF3488 and transglutaminase-like domain-containing protein [Halioglobus sp.]
MKAEQQLPRNALIWIILAQFSLVALHFERIPLWILLVHGVAAVWRFQVYAGRWSFPGRWVKAFLIISSFFGIYFSFGSLIGLEPTVALLLAAFALKLIELAKRKDAYVILFLGYFVCVTEFLFTQDLLIVLYSLLNVVLITTALVALHQPGEDRFNYRSIRPASVMLAQSIPLMLVLFFIFPRIGPLWSVPIRSHTAKTGVSDFMRPGDISHLSQSAEVAFRVQFDGEIPARSDLYWRGLVFSKLEKGAWTSLDYFDVPAGQRKHSPPKNLSDPTSYTVIMEPTQQNWLYSLRYAMPAEARVKRSSDYRLFSPAVLEDEFRYRVRSYTDAVLEPVLSDWRRRTELALPSGLNPQTEALALELRETVDSDRAFANRVLRKFNQEPFVYTLRPPMLGEHPMDDFLFVTQRGFCEHYAYAFVVMMRAGGVPARVVAGYQGGETNPVNSTVIVHQFDAHAWAEVWFPEEGWVRVDPTAAVSPDRIEWGLEQAVSAEGTFLSGSPLSPLRYRSVLWLNALRLRYDALTWQWQSWIVGYDSQQQYDFLENLLGEINPRKFALVLLGSWALILIPVGFSLLGGNRVQVRSEEDKHYRRFCALLAKHNLQRKPGESPGEFAARCTDVLPAAAGDLAYISDLYGQLAYANEGTNSEERLEKLRQLKRSVRRFRLPAQRKNPA